MLFLSELTNLMKVLVGFRFEEGFELLFVLIYLWTRIRSSQVKATLECCAVADHVSNQN